MKIPTRIELLLGFAAVLAVGPAEATVIDFTGGEVTLRNGSTQTTNNALSWNSVDHYIENGFKLDFIFAPPPPGPPSSPPAHSSYIGDYYNVGNDVIHGHWLNGSGSPTDLKMIEITKVGGGTFDLNYFILTSNSLVGPGGPATGTEAAWIKASNGYTQLLPSETWGFPATSVFLGSQFDNVSSVQFFTTNGVECFGMDMFYIDEAAPSSHVPESTSTLALAGLAMIGLGLVRRLQLRQ